MRQGYNAKEATTLLKASTTLATVGQLGAAQATENLTSVMNAYGIKVEEVMGVVDQLTNLDLHYAASSGGIATALQKVSSSAKQAGVSLEQLEAIITVTTQITQQAPEVIGTAWQSVFTR